MNNKTHCYRKRDMIHIASPSSIFLGLPRGRTVHSKPSFPHDRLLPVVVAERASAMGTPPQGLKFLRRMRLIDKLLPVLRPLNGPIGQNRQAAFILPPPQTSPYPVLSPGNQVRPQRVALHVAQDQKQMQASLYRETLEPPLIQMAGAGSVIMGMPALGLRVRQPLHDVRQLPSSLGQSTKCQWLGIRQCARMRIGIR